MIPGTKGADPVGPGAAATDDLNRNPRVPDGLGGVRQLPQGLLDQELPLSQVRLAQHLSLPGLQSGEAHVPQLGDPAGQVHGGFSRQDSGALHSHVHLDQDPGTDALHTRGAVDGLGVLELVHTDHHVGPAADVDQTVDLRRTHDLVGHEDVVDAGGSHDLRLPQLGAGDSVGSRFQAQIRQGRRLHRLGVGAPSHLGVANDSGRHAVDVALKDIQIHHQCRRIQRLPGLSHQTVHGAFLPPDFRLAIRRGNTNGIESIQFTTVLSCGG